MARYEIVGGASLNGEVTISGAKNAAVAILPAALLVNGVCRIENVPDISDVRILLAILEDMGAKIAYPEPGVVEIDSTVVSDKEPCCVFDLSWWMAYFGACSTRDFH